MFAQTGFIGHDAGHRQISSSRRIDDLIGRIHGNLLIGLSYGWWISKHNRHHAHPNQAGLDPDVGGRAIAFTACEFRARRGVGAWIARRQAWLFFPMLALEGLHLHAAGLLALPRHRTTPVKLSEAGLRRRTSADIWPPCSWCSPPCRRWRSSPCTRDCSASIWVLRSPPTTRACACSARTTKSTFLRRQVLTSRNVSGGWLTALVLGGLNYQIEHHLFPSMPRPNLRHAQAPVQAFCAKHGIPYAQTSLLDSYAQVLRHLNTVGGAVARETLHCHSRVTTIGQSPRTAAMQAHTEHDEPCPAGPRRSLPSSPFRVPEAPAPPVVRYLPQDRVTHDKYGLGTILSVEEGVAVTVTSVRTRGGSAPPAPK